MSTKFSSTEFVLGGLTLLCVLLMGGFYLYDRIDPLRSTTSHHAATAETIAKAEKMAQISAVVRSEDETDPLYVLKEAESEYLWDLEHHNNVLGKFGFQKLVDAWLVKDRSAMLDLLDTDFQGSLIRQDSSDGLLAKTERVDVSRYDGTAETTVDASGEAFVDFLLGFRDQFAVDPAPRGRFDVMTLKPPSTDQRTGTWTATCIHRLWGEAKSGGSLEVTLNLTIQTDTITKERLAEPGWLQTCSLKQVTSALATAPLFHDVTDESGIDVKGLHDNWLEEKKIINTGGVYACDFDRDGYTDLLITDKEIQFYRGGEGGKFQDVSEEVGLREKDSQDSTPRSTMTAAFADIDNDGWEDLVLPDSGRIYRNEEGKRFRDVSYESNLGKLLRAKPVSSIGGIVMADYDRDGLIDLYVTRSVPAVGSWLESRQPTMIGNQLLHNDGDWSFSDVTRKTQTGGGGRSCFTAVWADVNNDRWPDLYIINEFGSGALYVNHDGQSFEERELIDAAKDFGSMGLTCGDVNNDGNVDIYVANMYSKAGSRIMGNMLAEDYPEEVKQKLKNMVAGGELYLNEGDLKFKTKGKKFQVHAAGWAWGSSLADFDNDGWLDLYVTAGFMSRDRKKPDG